LRGDLAETHPKPCDAIMYSYSNLEIYSLRKCCEVEKRSGVYIEVHEHRIAKIVIFAAL